MTDRKAINELRRRQKAIGAAISALQERELRGKGCSGCTHKDDVYFHCDWCVRYPRQDFYLPLKGEDNG